MKTLNTKNNLSGKVAIVTGGSRSIGAAIAKRLAADGAAVVITYNGSPDKAHTVVKAIESNGGRALGIKADAADPQAVRQVVAKTIELLGRLSHLVDGGYTA